MTATTTGPVVVGIDGSDDGTRALHYAIALARREDLPLRLVHVASQTAMYAPMLPYLPELRVQELGESVLQEAEKVAVEAGWEQDRLQTVRADGPRTPALMANSHDAAHIVLGTRSSVMEHLFTGSTSLGVAARAEAPVHCVPRGREEAIAPTGVLVAGLEGTPADLDVLEETFRQAATRGAQVRLVHAWRPVNIYDVAIMGRTSRADWERAARELLDTIVDKVAVRHPDVVWELRLDYQRTPLALHAAAESADLLLLGRHGHHAPRGSRVGSNTRTLLRTATRPVVVVPVHHTAEG